MCACIMCAFVYDMCSYIAMCLSSFQLHTEMLYATKDAVECLNKFNYKAPCPIFYDHVHFLMTKPKTSRGVLLHVFHASDNAVTK